MTTRFKLSHAVLVRSLAVLSLAVVSLASSPLAEAQTTGSTATSATRSTTGTATSGATTATGTQDTASIDQSGLFSATTTNSGLNLGTIGANDGRFATNGFQNAPLATGTGTATTQTQALGNTARGAQQLNRGGNTNRTSQQQQFNRQSGRNQTTKRTVRPSLQLGFARPDLPNLAIQNNVTARVTSLATKAVMIADTRPEFSGVAVTVEDGGVLTLTGTVPSESAARLAANILRMEPGIRAVKNELTVAAAK